MVEIGTSGVFNTGTYNSTYGYEHIAASDTGTITFGNRLASRIVAFPGVTERDTLEAALLTSLEDETPEGRSVVELARARLSALDAAAGSGAKAAPSTPAAAEIATVVPFSAESRTSGVILADGTVVLKGAVDAIAAALDGDAPPELQTLADEISSLGATPLAIRRNGKPLGIIELKDTVKPGLKERFDELRRMGIRTIMVTGDNPLTAKTIAAEAGVDEFMAQAKPEDKIARIRAEQAAGHLVAMTGDGTNDAPALAQADVGLAMNTGTMAAKEAGNMVDLDSNPTKLIEVVAIGKQLLITRGALTTFSIMNDVSKYFAIIPAMFMITYPPLAKLNIMNLHTPQSAVLAAVIFNALIIVALVPLALRGVKYKPQSAAEMLRRNLWIYGVGGFIAPFPCIWFIDRVLGLLRLA